MKSCPSTPTDLRRRAEAPARAAAFTLVELLVVIGVIGILISILIPVLGKARRKAIVLACPIAYHSWNDNTIRLTDPQGYYDLALTPSYGFPHDRRPSGPMWSPSGLKIGFELSNWSGSGPQYMCVLDPMSGQITNLPQLPGQSRSYWTGWIDEDHFLEEATGGLSIRDMGGGVTRALGYTPFGASLLYPCPHGLPGKWITFDGKIRYVKADLTPGKAIWTPPKNDTYHVDAEDYPMDVDPMGEWVAWTESTGSDSRTAYKHTASPPNMPPYHLQLRSPNGPYPLGYFAAWTDDGHMLFCTGNGMAIVTKEGEIRRQWTTDNSPHSGWAAWRRYGHP